MANITYHIDKTNECSGNTDATNFAGGDVNDLVPANLVIYLTAQVLNPPIKLPDVISPPPSPSGTPGYDSTQQIIFSATAYETEDIFIGQHTASTWQVGDSSDFSNVVYEWLSDTTNLETLTIPPNTMGPGQYLYLRVRYESGYYTSGWTGARRFRTL